jgi:hypothetical protein
VVVVEHAIILVKNIIQFQTNVPEFISQGLKDRQAIKVEYKRNKEKKARRAKQKKGMEGEGEGLEIIEEPIDHDAEQEEEHDELPVNLDEALNFM